MNRLRLKGEVFGRLTVLDDAGSDRRGTLCRCRCSCGNEIVVVGRDLRRKHKQSCAATPA